MKRLSKNGFTMIELIFVIVILGILGAIAIPKLSAVKDDAQLANANENFCLNLNSSLMGYAVRHNGSLVGADLTKYTDTIDGTRWTMSQSGDKTDLVIGDINANKATSLKATFSNETNNVFVYIVDGNSTDYHKCLIGNKATDTKTADEARSLIQSGSNYL